MVDPFHRRRLPWALFGGIKVGDHHSSTEAMGYWVPSCGFQGLKLRATRLPCSIICTESKSQTRLELSSSMSIFDKVNRGGHLLIATLTTVKHCTPLIRTP